MAITIPFGLQSTDRIKPLVKETISSIETTARNYGLDPAATKATVDFLRKKLDLLTRTTQIATGLLLALAYYFRPIARVAGIGYLGYQIIDLYRDVKSSGITALGRNKTLDTAIAVAYVMGYAGYLALPDLAMTLYREGMAYKNGTSLWVSNQVQTSRHENF